MKGILTDFTKLGFTKLLKPFEKSIDDVIKITKSFGTATKAHTGQFRNENKIEPYINHPLKVALILTEELHLYNVNLVCAALLHDTIEKSRDNNRDILEDQLKKDFGDYIYNIVRTVTKPKIRSDEKGKVLEEYFGNIAKSSTDVRYLKLADRLDNIRDLKNAVHKDKILRYKQETQKYIVPIAEKMDEKVMLKLLVALYELK
jgi:(p)ppGpp synthase/HD superfamily hydrolase